MSAQIKPGSPILAIVGPTATGKSRVAVTVAQQLGCEIVSIDSMQVYRKLDIGTSKPDKEIMRKIPHHLIDVVEPYESFSVERFKRLADSAISEINARNHIPLLVGGSGLYFRAIVDNLDFSSSGEAEQDMQLRKNLEKLTTAELFELLKKEDSAAATEMQPENRRRVIRAIEVAMSIARPISERQASWAGYESPYKLAVAGLNMNRKILYKLIDERVDDMIKRGLLEEVRELKEKYDGLSMTSTEALGYKQFFEYLEGRCPLEKAVEEIKKKTRQYSKRQLTWFKKDPRVRWFNFDLGTTFSKEDIKRELERISREVVQYFRVVLG
ncbi:MAG: tRNA (adenosine(37)-N6)-dimethylallyltransferase MiaA [Actinomycetota bacterium]|nr:tRNA (adenosine(37)-N6)-dimethylallyltransferase MiaA [Actinomycetota bacterium]